MLMSDPAVPRTRTLTVFAQDPAVKGSDGRILRAQVIVPAEALAAGPWGHRVQIIDYDASTGTLYAPRDLDEDVADDGSYRDPYADVADDATLLGDPGFHAQNAYAIAMRTLAYFERTLGRRVGWGFAGHQLKIAPHAFADANAFYSTHDEALVFGYFPAGDGTMVFSCLSHDVVAHESTHALVDGLRRRFTDPSSPDQAGFHEGFADVVALLSVFSLPSVVDALLAGAAGDSPASGANGGRRRQRGASAQATPTVAAEQLTPDALRFSALLGLAEQMGQAMSGVRGQPLRRAAELKPSKDYLEDPAFREPHRRGEILLAAMMNAFLEVWTARLSGVREVAPGRLDRLRVVEEGVNAAEYLLTMAIRALDYTPPVDLQMGDFLSAMLTADTEIRPDDTKYEFRRHVIDSFAAYGIAPASTSADAPGCWKTGVDGALSYTRTHFESMLRDPDEVFWFIWENRKALGVYGDTYGHVLSVRPSLRVAPDGFTLRETVVEFIQVLQLAASELSGVVDEKTEGRPSVQKPPDMPDDTPVTLYGGNALIFDEYGRLKYNVHNGITDAVRQTERLAYLWEAGYFTSDGKQALSKFSQMHLRRALDLSVLTDRREEW